MSTPKTRPWPLAALTLSLALVACGPTAVPPDGGTPCVQDEECGVGEVCLGGRCRPLGGDEDQRPCSNDLGCGQGEICEGGLCIPGSREDGGLDAGDLVADGDGGGEEQPRVPSLTLAGDVITRQDTHGLTHEIDFGNVTVGQPVERNLVIRNGGQAPLSVSVVTIDLDPLGEFSLQPAVPPALEIQPGGETSLVVTYRAQDGRTDRAVAKLFSNDPERPQVSVNLVSEFKGEARIRLDPVLLDFGDLALGDSLTRTFSLENVGTGNAVLQVDRVQPEAGLATAFGVGLFDLDGQPVSPPVFLNREDALEARVTFQPQTRNSYEGDVVVQSSDPTSPVASVRVRGRAGAPRIEVGPARVNFGEVPVHTPAPPVEVEVQNTGVGLLTVSSIELAPGASAEFGLEGLPAFPLQLQPTQRAGFQVTYTPVDEGPDATQLVLAHDDPDRAPDVRLDVGGTGVRGNARPTALILADGQDTALLTVALNSQVGLDGRQSSDSDGTVVAYEWRIVQQPLSFPCGQPSTLPGTTNPVTALILREAGLTTLGLRVRDDQGAWSEEDLLDLQVHASPQANVRIGGNVSGHAEVLLGALVTFDGSYSTDCDGFVSEYLWRVVSFPPGRGAAPAISAGGTPALSANVTFDFPGDYVIGLKVRDNDVPQNESAEATFSVRVLGPRSFRIAANWTNQGLGDDRVDVDLHLLRPGSTWAQAKFTANDCHPRKPGAESGNPTPNWGFHGSPTYQRDSWEDGDNALDPNSPADEINFSEPGMGAYGIFVYFRCHSSTQFGSDYWCCDDLCSWGCSIFCLWCKPGDTDYCQRRAVGEVAVEITEHDGSRRLITRGFSFPREEGGTGRQIGVLSWPAGTFQ